MRTELFDNWDKKTQYEVRVLDWMFAIAVWRQTTHKREIVQFT